MTDRELLEAAAKAAGYKFEWYCRGANNPSGIPTVPCVNGEAWNPLESNADAFRLMVDRDVSLDTYEDCVEAMNRRNKPVEIYTDHNNDKHAATRRAIVRAAAGE